MADPWDPDCLGHTPLFRGKSPDDAVNTDDPFIDPVENDIVTPDIHPKIIPPIIPFGPSVDDKEDLAFTCRQTSPLGVTVKGGSIFWKNQIFVVDDSDEIAIPPDSDDFKIWIKLTPDEFEPGGAFFESGDGGWSDVTDYPEQPSIQADLYFLLCTIVSDNDEITDETHSWNGGDITWPHVPPDFGDFDVMVTGLDLTLFGGKVFWHEKDFTVGEPSSFSVPANSADWKIWLKLSGSVFNPSGCGLDSGTSLPTNDSPPARSYMHLVSADSDDNRITKVRTHFKGGVWTSIYGYHI